MTAARKKYLTGDRLTDAVLPAAQRLVMAAHTNDKVGVATAFADAELAAGDALRGAMALAVVLGAMCPDDTPPEKALEWRRNPTEYRRLRHAGVSSKEAAVLSAAVIENLWTAVKRRETSCPQGGLPAVGPSGEHADTQGVARGVA